uniref:NADPH oxidase organizer 1a n=1 Tax=Myripristis murdjan TaxID=586833 RepID=A0A667YAJ6_9TELE
MEPQRYPVSIRLIGVMHKEKSKMYMTSVLWSDQNDIVVYRSFQDFKKMHKQMKKAFPPANPLKKSDRIIPKFRGRYQKMRRGKKKGPSKSLVRLKFLEKYCNDLLSCDPRVIQTPSLIQFFHPKDQDLQPEFAKNSIMVMPSDDIMGGEGGQESRVGGGNVTQPFVTQTYRCVAPYETKDTKNKPFKVAVDEKLDVLIKDKAGWWLVENEDKRLAWFPAPFLEKCKLSALSHPGMLYTAAKSYKATKDDELTVEIGSVVEVLQKSENGWWLIRYSGKAGYIPSMFLKPYNNPHVRMAALQLDLRSSTLNLSQLQVPSSGLARQSHQLSYSQGNLLQLPGNRPSSPTPVQPPNKYKSRSLNTLSEPHQERGRSRTFSFSDDLSSSSASSSLNLSSGPVDKQLHLSRTPPPMMANRLSPASDMDAKIATSTSDPNLYRGPTTPKVPPRPRAQEILTRCTTITRKNASRPGTWSNSW